MHQIIKINGVEYWLKKVVGQGAFGKVYEAFNQQNQQQVAIKEVDKRKFQFEELIAQTRMEIYILNTIQQPKNLNIIEFIGSQETENFFYMILEYCPISLGQCTTLFMRDLIGENVVKSLLFQVVNGLKALHSKKIIHRDLKLENIMLKTDKQRWDQLANNEQRTQEDIDEFLSTVTLKLIDFGVSKANTNDELSTTVAGSDYIMAPEIRMNQPYNEKVDIYSLGVIYNKLLTGKLPFIPTLVISYDKQEPLVFDENLHLSTQTKKLLRKMLKFKPEYRPTIDQVYEWLKPNIFLKPNQTNQPTDLENTMVIQEKLQSKKVKIQVVESPENDLPETHQLEKESHEVQEGKMFSSTENEIDQVHNTVDDSLTKVQPENGLLVNQNQSNEAKQASDELERDRNSSEGWNQNQPNEDQQRNHQDGRETEQGNQSIEIINQYQQSVEITNTLDIPQSQIRKDQLSLDKKLIGINQQQAPSDQTHVQMNLPKYQDQVEKKTVEITNYHPDLDRTNGQFHDIQDQLKTKPNRLRQGQYNEENNLQAEKQYPPTQQEKCVFDYQYIHSTACYEFQIQAKSIDDFCDILHQILQMVPKFVGVDLWQILGGLTPLACMLEFDYRMRVNEECYLFQHKLKSINEAITKVLHHFRYFSEAYELSKKTSYEELLEKITGDAIQWIVDNTPRNNLQSNIFIQIKLEKLLLWAKGGLAKSTLENQPSEQPSTDLTLKTAYSKKIKQSNVDVYDPDNIQRQTKEVEKKSQQMDRLNKKSNQYQDVVDQTPLESIKYDQPRDPYINQPNTGHRQNDYDFQKKPMQVNEQTQQRNQTNNQFNTKPYRQRLDQIDEENFQTDDEPTPLQQEKCVYYIQLRKYHHSSACDEFQIQAKGIDSFCQRLKDFLRLFPEFLGLDLSQILSGLMPLTIRLENECGSRVDQACYLYKSKLKFMKKRIREFEGSFPNVQKFDEPSKKMTYKEMLEKVTEDAIQWIIIDAQGRYLQSNTLFQLSIERLMLWDEETTKQVAYSKSEKTPLSQQRIDLTLTKVHSANSSQSNADINGPSNNISRQTNPLDDRCNIEEEIHFCILADHYQTCRIVQCIHKTLESYQTIQEFPNDQFIELACIYKQTLTPILEELEGYQRTDIELRSCYRHLFQSLNQLKRDLDKLLEWSKFTLYPEDTVLPDWRAEPIYFHKFIIGLLNLLKEKSWFDRSQPPIQRTITFLIQLQNLLGHTDPQVRIIDTTERWEAQEFINMFKEWAEATKQTEKQRTLIMSLLRDLNPHYRQTLKPHLEQQQRVQRLREGRR